MNNKFGCSWIHSQPAHSLTHFQTWPPAPPWPHLVTHYIHTILSPHTRGEGEYLALFIVRRPWPALLPSDEDHLKSVSSLRPLTIHTSGIYLSISILYTLYITPIHCAPEFVLSFCFLGGFFLPYLLSLFFCGDCIYTPT